jgi:histidinol dehydrogenase
MNAAINYLDSESVEFESNLAQLLDNQGKLTEDVEDTVRNILEKVQQGGDEAVIALTNKFDSRSVQSFDELTLDAARLDLARQRVDSKLMKALSQAAEQIRRYHEEQQQGSWRYLDDQGNELGQMIRPVDSAGIYVPGGKASYPSSVLMTAIPARVAGVEQITLVVPAPAGEIKESVLAAAAISGVNRIYTIGGAQAVAALAYGTETVTSVDKIVGPGNIYVATAKRLVYGLVGIDMIAGPSEVIIIADNSASPEWLVMDLFAQAEHDEQAQSILISEHQDLLNDVDRLIAERLPSMERSDIIAKSLIQRGALIKTRNLQEAIAISNQIAPEHLELALQDPESVLEDIRHAGAIFVGHYAAESMGDYSAGPSHVLPTAGTARFSSPLGVYDFQKRSSIIKCSQKGAARLGETASVLAREEGLIAHALSAECRINGRLPASKT